MSRTVYTIHPLFNELSDNKVETKTCRRCNEAKHKSEFAHRSFNRNGEKEYKNYCKACDKIATKQVALIKKQVGPIPEDHICECCRRSEETILQEYRLFQGTMKKTVWVYDHDYKTGKFRGIICQPCNSILGNLQDDPTIAEKVIEYISTWQT